MDAGEMSPTAPEHRTQSYEEDYGLNIVAKHINSISGTNATRSEDAEELALYDAYPSSPRHNESRSYGDSLTPRSNAASEGIRTRSGRSTRSIESPYNIVKTRTSKSSAARTKRQKKSKLDKSKMPNLTAPLSELTRDLSVPLKDIEAWVNRPMEERIREVEKRNGYVTRPMNSFMLYRSAYADRTKQWCLQNNHQVVSSVSGVSWPMEPPEIRHQYDEWAKLERANHQAAHPTYKFSPSKSTTKRRKAEISDDEDEASDLDTDPDGEYRESRTSRRRKQVPKDSTFLPTSNLIESLPYYSHSGNAYDLAQYQIMNPAPTLSSNFAYDPNDPPYTQQTSSHIPSNIYQHTQYPYVHKTPEAREPASSPPNGSQSLGRYGIPGSHSSDRMLYDSRTGSPVPSCGQYLQPLYPQHASYPMQYQTTYMGFPTVPAQASVYTYEHQRYLQQASQPRSAIDPSLEAVLGSAANNTGHEDLSGQSHFDDALGDLTAQADFDDPHDYFVRSSSPSDVNATLAPTWMPEEL